MSALDLLDPRDPADDRGPGLRGALGGAGARGTRGGRWPARPADRAHGHGQDRVGHAPGLPRAPAPDERRVLGNLRHPAPGPQPRHPRADGVVVWLARPDGRRPARRHHPGRAAEAGPPPAGPADHHPRVAPGDLHGQDPEKAPRRREVRHRRRDPRARGLEARGPALGRARADPDVSRAISSGSASRLRSATPTRWRGSSAACARSPWSRCRSRRRSSSAWSTLASSSTPRPGASSARSTRPARTWSSPTRA